MSQPALLYFASVFWDDPLITPQQIALRLAYRYTVLYVEPSLSHPYLRDVRRNRRWLNVGRRPRQVADRLCVYTPPPMLPLKTRASWINTLSQWWISPFVRRAAASLGIERPVLFTFLPHTWVMVGRYDEALACYYCIDDMRTLSWIINPRVVADYERRLLARVQLVFTTSNTLRKRFLDDHPEVHWVPNGCVPELYGRALDPTLEIPAEIASLPRPVVGFSGLVDFRLDQELLAEVARRRPDWSLVFVGPVRTPVTRLRALANVRFIPAQPVTALPAYFKGFTVGIIPYIQHPMVSSIYPTKLNEYLAAGLSVVSTPLAELEGLPAEIVRQAADADGFVAAVERAIEEDHALRQVRLAFAWANSWDQRATTIANHIDRHLLS